MRRRAARAHVAVVVSGWPRVSETFALNELLALHEAGMLAAVFATKGGDRSLYQPGWDRLEPFVEVLADVGVDEQGRLVARRLTGAGVTGVHGYFAHRPAAVAEVAATRLGIPFGFSVHALDVRKVAASELAARAAGAALVVSCNADAADAIRGLGTEPCVVGHGVDLARFRPSAPPAAGIPSLLAVGRLVEKKGFHVLIESLAGLARPFRLRLVGDGPERERLVRTVAHHRLSGSVELIGRRTHAELPALYAEADVVVVPSVVDTAGDRDGLPNVVLEAMASGRPVVASDVAAIASAVRTGVTGMLVPPDDPAALARALVALVDDRALAARLGRAGRARAVEQFDLAESGRALCDTLAQSYG